MTFPKVFNVNNLNGTNGFTIVGDVSHLFGYSVGGIGDINGDGLSDLILGSGLQGEQAYVLFGTNTFPAAVYTSNLYGRHGFAITCSSQPDINFGYSVAGLGDLNGDGEDDFALGAPSIVNPPGQVFVIFGTYAFPPILDVSSLNGGNGFTIVGQSINSLGASVAGIGDINKDGNQDFIIGTRSNYVYVIFGQDKFPATIDISELNGKNGFQIVGPSSASPITTFPVAVSGGGDVNGDRIYDIIFGMSGVDLSKAFVIFGATSFPAIVHTSSLNGTNGFTITGAGYFGKAVAGGFDINGDGKSDVAAGDPETGEAYVIFGTNHFPATMDVSSLNGSNGFKIVGSSDAYFGNSMAGLGSINGNGKSSLIVGTSNVVDQAFVFFGADTFPAQIAASDLNGENGFELVGPYNSDFGYSVASLSDLTGTSKPAFIVGAESSSLAFVVLDASI